MYSSEVLLNELGAGDGPFEIEHPELWIVEPPRSARDRLYVDAQLSVSFASMPVASALAAALLEIDREARRVATAMQRQVPPSDLFGRGRRLVPLRDGLTVRAAVPGSLVVEALFGGLVGLVTSQPMSFVLNLAALLQFGRVAVEAGVPSGRSRRKEGWVQPISRAVRGDTYEETFAPVARISTSAGELVLPEGLGHVTVDLRAADGSTLHVDIPPD